MSENWAGCDFVVTFDENGGSVEICSKCGIKRITSKEEKLNGCDSEWFENARIYDSQGTYIDEHYYLIGVGKHHDYAPPVAILADGINDCEKGVTLRSTCTRCADISDEIVYYHMNEVTRYELLSTSSNCSEGWKFVRECTLCKKKLNVGSSYGHAWSSQSTVYSNETLGIKVDSVRCLICNVGSYIVEDSAHDFYKRGNTYTSYTTNTEKTYIKILTQKMNNIGTCWTEYDTDVKYTDYSGNILFEVKYQHTEETHAVRNVLREDGEIYSEKCIKCGFDPNTIYADAQREEGLLQDQ